MPTLTEVQGVPALPEVRRAKPGDGDAIAAIAAEVQALHAAARPDLLRARRLLASIGLLLAVALPLRAVRAHPAVAVVRDAQGNIFYSDLEHVWRITPAGRKSIVVRGVHAHELSIDSLGNVYGEDSRYLGSGEGDDRYHHRVWRRSPDGRVTDVIPWSPGFWRPYGLARDRAGTTYWPQCPERRCSVMRRTAAGAIAVVAPPGRFTTRINWMVPSVTEPGVLFVADGTALRRLDAAGRVTTVAPSVGTMLMGMWPTADGRDVLVAAHGERRVVRVRLADGRVTTLARSPAPWAPSGVLLAPDGVLWVLEFQGVTTRMRSVAPDGTSRTF